MVILGGSGSAHMLRLRFAVKTLMKKMMQRHQFLYYFDARMKNVTESIMLIAHLIKVDSLWMRRVAGCFPFYATYTLKKFSSVLVNENMTTLRPWYSAMNAMIGFIRHAKE